MHKRYYFFYFSIFSLLLSMINMAITGNGFFWFLITFFIVVIGFYDISQGQRTILRNYPIIGHLRYFFEFIRPEIRQYFIESDTESVPFSRTQRSLVYQRSKQQSDKRPFGSQLDHEHEQYLWLTHSIKTSFIKDHDFRVMIGDHGCQKPYSASIFNISAMSFGALSGNAIKALNTGAKKGNFAQDTGEGSISKYHHYGGDLIWEIGSGYFGCRDSKGQFNEENFSEMSSHQQVKMIEIKLSQGAKPGHGGILPAKKVTTEIAVARGIEAYQDCISPANHSSFESPEGLIEFIKNLKQLSGGKPVGIKLCIGKPQDWLAIVKAMLKNGTAPDFIVIDGAEGGTGAAPLEFIDHVGMPMKEALHLVHNSLIGTGLRDRIKIGCAGKIISAFDICLAQALGADWCNSARGFMFSLGCIQSLSCHTDQCPTGVATQDPLRQQGLIVKDKAERVYHYHQNTLVALKELMEAAGLSHPCEITKENIHLKKDAKLSLLSDLYPEIEANNILNSNFKNLPAWFEACWRAADEKTF
jgi:glutamate synthase domain-containing protein 2